MNAVAKPSAPALPLWRRLALGAALLLLGGGTYLAARYWPALWEQPRITAPAPEACDLRTGSCTAHFRDGAGITLDIEPKTLPPMQPLRVVVRLQGLAAEQVEVDFQGRTMNMGVNRSPLLATGADEYAGEAILPVCVRRRMDWRAEVLVDTGQGIRAAPFYFATEAP